MIYDVAYNEATSSWMHQTTPKEGMNNLKAIEIPQVFRIQK